jgi:hypothetical phage lipoprotein|nr:MAG TPA: TRAF PROTEIN, TRAO PROTEIN, TRAN ADHESION, BACTERIAL SECRETION.5A [Caudoviricetes sp.]
MKSMKKFILILFSILIAGCSFNSPELKQIELPKPYEKPIPQEYNVQIIEFDSQKFYCLSPQNARILSLNWLEYKSWAESNYDLLNFLNSLNKGENK